ncbi:MAG: hypothetical protein R3C56_37920 [Pirellulaceae bacterium]
MPRTCFFVQMLSLDNKKESLLSHVSAINEGRLDEDGYIVAPGQFEKISGTPFCYWAHRSLLRAFDAYEPFEDENAGRASKCGLGTLDDFRFIRNMWETAPSEIWKLYLGGGKYSPVLGQFPAVCNWGDAGHEVKVFVELKVGSSWS